MIETPAIDLQQVGRSFGEGHTAVVALHPTDLSVGVGEFVATLLGFFAGHHLERWLYFKRRLD